ncbi:MotA/TolQ/ExbB proton channel family protein [Halanaerobium salsuginis]|jgi:biopolymer transport protein ExbB|uniref:Biopolymer transport protein ExbB n=1 Tax=Halanaerobium salsuginis TaxID=29563 RepID=A0A1I4FBN6_9FIRM|nr:MotA/TolQ/ExbB proton channel family protein [Halanaerobium salsuginis]SFL14949.1 biopolymer transport protein ExbB [Halanaerobium salsuginis]
MLSQFIAKAGLTAYPLLITAFLTIFIIIERGLFFLLNYRQLKKNSYLVLLNNFYFKKSEQLSPGDYLKKQGLAGAIYSQVLKKKPITWQEFKLYLEAEEIKKLPELERGLGLLYFLAQISPTLGLLGTVTGMIKTFQILASNINPEQLATGIYEALFTTAAGLLISIPAAGFYYFYYAKIKKLRNQLLNLELEIEAYFKKKIDLSKQIESDLPEFEEELTTNEVSA